MKAANVPMEIHLDRGLKTATLLDGLTAITIDNKVAT